MQNQEMARQIQRLRGLFTETTKISSLGGELQGHWARYLCVLSAGLVENGLKEIYSEFATQNTSEPIGLFVAKVLKAIQNPKHFRFLEQAGAFRPEWKDELQLFFDENGRKEAIDAIMDNRHKIVHGKNSDISVVRLREYLDKSIEVLEFIETQCKR